MTITPPQAALTATPGTPAQAPLSLKLALAEAFGHRSYVLLVLGFFTCGFQLAFVTVHLPAYLKDAGLASWVGGWTLAVGGQHLFALQLIDRTGFVEGAWRDLRRPGALDASGLIDAAEWTGGDLTLRFTGAVLVIRPAGVGWTGELTEGGSTKAARLIRRDP